MQKLNMSYIELMEIFSICELTTLDSLEILLENVTNYDLSESIMALRSAYNKVWDKNKEEFEGINEYDFLTKLHNFDISELVYVIDSNNQNELNYIKCLIIDSIKNIKENKCAELEVLPNLEESLNKINMYLEELSPIVHKLNNDELKVLFNKYTAAELESFDTIFKYIYNYDLSEVTKIKNMVQKEKQCNEKNEDVKNDCKYKLLNLINKNVILDKKEIYFLIELLEEADYNVTTKKFEGYRGAPTLEISNFHESLLEERDRRKVKIRIKKLGN